jgi:hypothetical protein
MKWQVLIAFPAALAACLTGCRQAPPGAAKRDLDAEQAKVVGKDARNAQTFPVTKGVTAGIPPAIMKMIYDSDEFKKDIELPIGVVPADREEIYQYRERLAAWRRTQSGFPPANPAGLNVEDPRSNNKLIALLASLGYVQVEPVQVGQWGSSGYREATWYYVLFDPKLNSYLGHRNSLRIARRKIVKITYANRYKMNPFGMGETEAFGLTFSYLLQETFPGFPHIEKEFTGKGRFVLDPGDGEWKRQPGSLGAVELSDRGGMEYLEIIQSPNFTIPQQARPAGATDATAVEVVGFNHRAGSFRKQGAVWIEYDQSGRPIYTFQEVSRDSSFIVLKDESRGVWLRLPTGGGQSFWASGSGGPWHALHDLTVVKGAGARVQFQ